MQKKKSSLYGCLGYQERLQHFKVEKDIEGGQGKTLTRPADEDFR